MCLCIPGHIHCSCSTVMALLCIPLSKLVSFAFSTIPIYPFLIQRIFSFTCIYSTYNRTFVTEKTFFLPPQKMARLQWNVRLRNHACGAHSYGGRKPRNTLPCDSFRRPYCVLSNYGLYNTHARATGGLSTIDT